MTKKSKKKKDLRVFLVDTDQTASVVFSDEEERFLEDIPILMDENSNDEYFTLAGLLQAEQRRLAKLHGITVSQKFALLMLFADVHSKIKGIKQKFRFNKLLFYLMKRLDEYYGENSLLFDEIVAARDGPIPRHLKEDIKELQEKGLVEIYIDRDGKKIHKSDENWEELMHKKVGSCVVILTEAGEKVAKEIWYELGEDMVMIIQKTKEDIIYMDTEQLKEKVHKEYPEFRKTYVEDDVEDWYEAILQ